MTKVFLGGSRHISRLSAPVRERLINIISKNLAVVVGDANGADKAMQTFLDEQGYRNVQVFCSGHLCRNNVGNWETKLVEANTRERDFAFYSAKDRIMANEATFGLMIWDGKSVGTLLNVWRLVENHKKVVVYMAPEKLFFELKDSSQWEQLISKCDPTVKKKLAQKTCEEAKANQQKTQSELPLLS